MAAATRVAVVTGSNQGIGKAIVAGLLKDGRYRVVMTARRPQEAEAARQEIVNAAAAAGSAATASAPSLIEVCPSPVDITVDAHAKALAAYIDDKHAGRLDVLINNAGFAYKGDTFGAEEARITIGVNFLGTARMTEALLPALRKTAAEQGEARIINVCSQAGRLGQVSPALQSAFTDPNASKDSIQSLTDTFVTSIADGSYSGKGWPKSMYGVSKLAEIAYTFALAKQLEGDGIVVNAVCPGYCSTNMSSYKGPRSPEQGADTPVWLATRDSEHARKGKVNELTGGLYYDRQLISW